MRSKLLPSRRAILGALFIDALGSGLWLPFNLIFFTKAQEQALSVAGFALTVGSIAGLVFGQLSGPVVDRYGGGALIVASNTIRACTFALYPFIHSAWQMIIGVFFVFAADRIFWTANVPFVSTLVEGRELDKLLGTSSVLRMIGLGSGAALAGFFSGSVSGLRMLAWLNAVSFLIAGALTCVAVTHARRLANAPEPGIKPSERVSPIRPDRRYLELCLAQVLFVIISSAFVIILPIVCINEFHGPSWLPGTAIIVGNVVLAATQKPLLSVASRYSRSSTLLTSVPMYIAAFALLIPGRAAWGAGIVGVVLIASAIGGVGEVVSSALMLAAANDAAPVGSKGRYSALFQTSWGLAEAIAPVLFALLLSCGNAVLWTALCVIAILLVPMLHRLRRAFPANVLASTAAG
jgi:MFS family permease